MSDWKWIHYNSCEGIGYRSGSRFLDQSQITITYPLTKTAELARISHEHCVNLFQRQEEQDILQKQERYQISTVFTKGALKEMPLGYSPGNAIFFSVLAMNIVYYSPLPKTSNLTLRGLMRNPG